jgi:hypothetical protein
MAGTPEIIGRLIADQALQRGERQLLQKQPDGRTAASPPSPNSGVFARPIVHNDRAVAGMLTAMIDEQLQALESMEDVSTKKPASVSERVGERYANDEASVRDDERRLPELPAHQLIGNAQAMLAASSPEFRMVLGSAFTAAALRAQTESVQPSDASGKRGVPAPFLSINRVIAAAIFLSLLCVLAGLVGR